AGRAATELARSLEDLLVEALSAAHDRGDELAPPGTQVLPQAVGDLRARLRMDRAIAARAMLLTDLRIQQPQVVIDLGDRRDGGLASPPARALFDRDRRRNAEQELDVGFGEHLEELPRISRQAVNVTTLSLRIDDVEGQRRLPRAGKAGHHDDCIARHVD